MHLFFNCPFTSFVLTVPGPTSPSTQETMPEAQTTTTTHLGAFVNILFLIRLHDPPTPKPLHPLKIRSARPQTPSASSSSTMPTLTGSIPTPLKTLLERLGSFEMPALYVWSVHPSFCTYKIAIADIRCSMLVNTDLVIQ